MICRLLKHLRFVDLLFIYNKFWNDDEAEQLNKIWAGTVINTIDYDLDNHTETGSFYFAHCKNCLHRSSFKGLATAIPEFCPECGEKLISAGPMWLGPIQNEEFIDSMIEIAEEKELNTKKKVLKLLNSCKIEANAPETFYEIHKVCRALKISAPKLDKVFETLEEKGFFAVKTHYSPLGIKTNATNKELEEIVKSLVDELE